ncbi:MAG TPA: SDR family oxidoreductase [Ktedonobacterales bacterium]|jgi:NADH dehydrogenase
MILIVGASGRLGGMVARRLLAEGRPVRALSRMPAKVEELRALGAEVVTGDLRDAAALARACVGADSVFAAAHAFDSRGDNVPRTVDDTGNRALIDAARTAGVGHFLLTSIMGARADHPVDLFRAKYAAEEHLRASGLSYTILRPTAFMELWATIIGDPIARRGKALIFGRGTNPINWVAAQDVAHLAHIALDDARARGQVIAIGGPENLSLAQVVALCERAVGRAASKQHIPLPMMRVMRVLARPINPAFSRQIATGILMDTQDMTFDPAATLARFPLALTHFATVIQRQYAPAASAV